MVFDTKRRALEEFGRQVKASGDGTELSASASSENLAFLALNLADVVNGVRTPRPQVPALARAPSTVTKRRGAVVNAPPGIETLRSSVRQPL